jgi:hypothetical protein
MNTCHFSLVVYNTRSRNVIAASGGDLKLEEISIFFPSTNIAANSTWWNKFKTNKQEPRYARTNSKKVPNH